MKPLTPVERRELCEYLTIAASALRSVPLSMNQNIGELSALFLRYAIRADKLRDKLKGGTS